MRTLRLALAFLFISLSAQAQTTWLPQSRYQQQQTYGLFIDEQSTLVYRHSKRAWGTIGGAIALAEKSDWRWKPQLVIHASANTSFRFNDKLDTLLTETVDARIGPAILLELAEDQRVTVGWTHQSGHISDNVEDGFLFGSNLGNEILYVRWVKDIQRSFRWGGTLRPYVGAEPSMKRFAADQFFEWFPWGAAINSQQDPKSPAPYLAAGLEEYGNTHIHLSWHVQAGAFLGNHFEPIRASAIRGVLGFYQGLDPRLKYAQIKNSKAQFWYAGLMFDL